MDICVTHPTIGVTEWPCLCGAPARCARERLVSCVELPAGHPPMSCNFGTCGDAMIGEHEGGVVTAQMAVWVACPCHR